VQGVSWSNSPLDTAVSFKQLRSVSALDTTTVCYEYLFFCPLSPSASCHSQEASCCLHLLCTAVSSHRPRPHPIDPDLMSAPPPPLPCQLCLHLCPTSPSAGDILVGQPPVYSGLIHELFPDLLPSSPWLQRDVVLLGLSVLLLAPLCLQRDLSRLSGVAVIGKGAGQGVGWGWGWGGRGVWGYLSYVVVAHLSCKV
jgi:hypothetical protein